jgi:hypothetical protein
MLAMVVNDDAGCLTPRGAADFFASMLAPTEIRVGYNDSRHPARSFPNFSSTCSYP